MSKQLEQRVEKFSDALEYIININILKKTKSKLAKAFRNRKDKPRELRKNKKEANLIIDNASRIYEKVVLNYDRGKIARFSEELDIISFEALRDDCIEYVEKISNYLEQEKTRKIVNEFG